MMDVLRIEDRGPVRVLTLNRPAKLNALDFALTRSLVEALQEADRTDSVRCLILTGEGRGFCSGADLNELSELTPANPSLVAERARLTAELHLLLPRMRIPTLAAVNGPAMGGGAGLALACDLTLASEEARFAYPEVKHGIVPAIVMANLVRVVGRKKAFELVSTGRFVSASEALELGMVNDVLPRSELLPKSMALAESLASVDPRAMELTKSLFYRAPDLDFADAIDAGRRANEAMRAFRKPT